MLPVVIIPPTDAVVSLEDVKLHLRWDGDDSLDTLLEGYVETAVTYVEQVTRRSLGRQTLRLSADSFRRIELLRPPFVNLVEIAFDGEVLDLTDFYVTDALVPSLVAYSRVNDSCVARDVRDGPPPVSVTYVAGYEVVPKSLKSAVMLQAQLLADRFDINEKADLERTRDALMSSFRVFTF